MTTKDGSKIPTAKMNLITNKLISLANKLISFNLTIGKGYLLWLVSKTCNKIKHEIKLRGVVERTTLLLLTVSINLENQNVGFYEGFLFVS